jgi:hypothetical protein
VKNRVVIPPLLTSRKEKSYPHGRFFHQSGKDFGMAIKTGNVIVRG